MGDPPHPLGERRVAELVRMRMPGLQVSSVALIGEGVDNRTRLGWWRHYWFVGISNFTPGASLAELREAFDRDGAFVLRDVLDDVSLAAVRDALRPLVEDAALGTNSFDGFKTRRVFDPLARTRALDDLMLSPVVHSAVQDVLPDGYQLGMTVLSEVQRHPGGGGTRSRCPVARNPPGTPRLQSGQRLLRLYRRPAAS